MRMIHGMTRPAHLARIGWLAAGLLFGATHASAANPSPEGQAPRPCPICKAANDPNTPYPERAGTSLLRGATNTAFGWTELMMQPAAEVERGGNVAVGIGKGLGAAVQRTAAGIGEMFPFWVPKGKQGYPILTRDCPICSLPQAQHPPATSDVAKNATKN